MNSAVNNSVVGMFDALQPTAGASGTRKAASGLTASGNGAVEVIALTAAP